MNTIKNWSSEDLQAYLKEQGYHPTYWKGKNRGFYNPRNRQTVLVPIEDIMLSKYEIIALFTESEAADMPVELEWRQFQTFILKYKNKMLGRNYRPIPQERLDAFVREHNNDPNSKCKIGSIETITIYPKTPSQKI